MLKKYTLEDCLYLIVVRKLFPARQLIKWLRENAAIGVLILNHCFNKLHHLLDKFLVSLPLLSPSTSRIPREAAQP